MWIFVISWMVIILYTLCLTFVTMFCMMQFHLMVLYNRGRKNKVVVKPNWINSGALPKVTIQLPIFNERFVVKRLLDNIVQIDYPSDRLEIQVLDDSTDDTQDLCGQLVNAYQQQGIPILHLHRSHRDGFKAGALRDGMKSAHGEFIAIFDADFLPSPDFLFNTLPYFEDAKTGVVQTRWDHLNSSFSLITLLQAFQLNVHFTIEQTGRQSGNYFRQFNGTAGIWRRETIDDAGGWRAETLTEDLDISYRAQLKGWNIIYDQDITSPAELPIEMTGLKSQQFRWMKGGAENARLFIPQIIKSAWPWRHRMHAILHLLSSAIFPVVFLLSILSLPVLLLYDDVQLDMRFYIIFLIAIPALGWVYYTANRDTLWADQPTFNKLLKFILMFPLFLSFSMGLSLHNTIAVVEGLLGRKSAFIRTPKFNIQKEQHHPKQKIYRVNQLSVTTILEGLFALYFMVAIFLGYHTGNSSFIIYHFMLMIGFGGIFLYSIKHLNPS